MLRFKGVMSSDIKSAIQIEAAKAGDILNHFTFAELSLWSIKSFTLKADFSARTEAKNSVGTVAGLVYGLGAEAFRIIC